MDQINKPLWDIAIRELANIERCLSPKTKMNCIYSCFKLLDSTFSLFTTEDGINAACADDILNIFPYIILRSKIERLHAHLRYLDFILYQIIDSLRYLTSLQRSRVLTRPHTLKLS